MELREEFANGDQFGSAEQEKQYSPYVQKCAQDTYLIAGKT